MYKKKERNHHIIRMYNDVAVFHERFELPQQSESGVLPDSLKEFREGFVKEEATEIFEAMAKLNKPDALDGLIDLAYVALGTMYLGGGTKHDVYAYERKEMLSFFEISVITETFELEKARDMFHQMVRIADGCRQMAINYGWDFDKGWRRVQMANMHKVRAKSNDESKRGSTWDVVKPDGWMAPFMEDLV